MVFLRNMNGTFIIDVADVNIIVFGGLRSLVYGGSTLKVECLVGNFSLRLDKNVVISTKFIGGMIIEELNGNICLVKNKDKLIARIVSKKKIIFEEDLNVKGE